MLFASTELAARIERAECGLLRDSVEAVARTHPDRDTWIEPLAGGVATYAGPGSPLNKVAGLGFAEDVPPPALEAVEQLCHERGCAVQIELSSLGAPVVAPMLTERGYRLVGFENVLGRDPRTAAEHERRPSGAGRIEVDVAGESSFDVWLDTVVTGFLAADHEGVPSHETFERRALEEVMGDMARASGLVRYLARRGGAPAGGASLRIEGEVAQLAGASTLPAHRRNGVQTMLLERRLADAAKAGCTVAVVTTQPGSVSQKNAQAKGFQLLYTRAVLVLEAPR